MWWPWYRRNDGLGQTSSITQYESDLHCESKSSPTPKLFATFSLRLNIFPWNFANLLPIYIHTYLPVLVYSSRYLAKCVNFSRSRPPYRYYCFEFRVSTSQISVTSSPKMSVRASNSSDLSPLNYSLSGLGQCRSLLTSYNRSQKQFLVWRCTYSWL